MNISLLRRLLAATGLVLCVTHSAAAELAVIVSAKSPLAALRSDQVADIFLGQAVRFPDGVEAMALDQSVGSAQRDVFYTKVVAKTAPLLKAYWTKMVFTGRGRPPREVANSAAVRKMVADNPSLIGYIDKASLDASVKTVLLVQ